MASPRRSDADIIAGSLEDSSQFGELFDRHAAKVFTFAARRIGVEDAEDVVSGTFGTAFRIRRRFDLDRESALPWLLGIAANTIGGILRSRGRKDRLYLAMPADRPSGLDESEIADRIDAERIGRQVNHVLAGMPARDRDALLLHALDDFTYSEIGKILGVPPGTVGSRISRARRKLREALGDIEAILGEDRGQGEGDSE
ncbi:MAG: RNA polymerase sigma factor [Acidimicrobiia bacterium]